MNSSPSEAPLEERKDLKWRIAAIACLLFVFFKECLASYFSDDDMMNLSGYVTEGWSVVKGLFLFWSGSYNRPMGGLLYLSLYHLFGFTRLPFHLVALALLLYNILLTGRIAYLLFRSRSITLLIVLLTCYHASEYQLYYDFGTIYDVVCFSFLYSAFALYLHRREQGQVLSGRMIATVALLQIGALDSKEMGVLLPAFILLYEACIVWPASRRLPTFRVLMPILVTGSISLVFILGKAAGTGYMFHHPSYTPVLSYRLYAANMAHYLGHLFYIDNLSGTAAILFLAAGLAIALLIRSPLMIFGWLWFLIALLPLAFIPGRGGFALYVPAPGMAVALIAFWQTIAKPYLATLGAPRYSLFNPRSAAAFTLVFLGIFILDYRQRAYYDPQIVPTMTAYRQLGKALAGLTPHPRKGARILFLNDPFPRDNADAHNLPFLLRHDSAVRVARARFNLLALSPELTPTYNEIYDYRDNRLIKVGAGDLPSAMQGIHERDGKLVAVSGVFLDIDDVLWTKQDYQLRARCPNGVRECTVAVTTSLPSPGYPSGEAHTITVALDGAVQQSLTVTAGNRTTDVKIDIPGDGQDHTLSYHLDKIMHAAADTRELAMLITRATLTPSQS